MFGLHVSSKSAVLNSDKTSATHKSLRDALEYHMEHYKSKAAQIFVAGPQNCRMNKIDHKEIHNLVEKHKLNLVVHSAYCTVGIWNNLGLLNFVEAQLKATRDCGAWGLVIHISKHEAEKIATIMNNNLVPLAEKYNVKILLEMTAAKADTTTFETPQKLANLQNLIKKSNMWGFTIDTAHIWGAGVDIADEKIMREWLLDVANLKLQILQIHLNGSSVLLGSGKDIHEIPGADTDKIFKFSAGKNNSLKTIMTFAIREKIVITLEVNRGYETDIFNAHSFFIQMRNI